MSIIEIREQGGSVVIDWTHIFKKYSGKWVALEDDETTVIVADKNPRTVKTKALKMGFEHPILIKVPSKLTPYIG